MNTSTNRNIIASDIDNSDNYPSGYIVSEETKDRSDYLTSFNAPKAAFESMTRQPVSRRGWLNKS